MRAIVWWVNKGSTDFVLVHFSSWTFSKRLPNLVPVTLTIQRVAARHDILLILITILICCLTYHVKQKFKSVIHMYIQQRWRAWNYSIWLRLMSEPYKIEFYCARPSVKSNSAARVWVCPAQRLSKVKTKHFSSLKLEVGAFNHLWMIPSHPINQNIL